MMYLQDEINVDIDQFMTVFLQKFQCVAGIYGPVDTIAGTEGLIDEIEVLCIDGDNENGAHDLLPCLCPSQ